MSLPSICGRRESKTRLAAILALVITALGFMTAPAWAQFYSQFKDFPGMVLNPAINAYTNSDGAYPQGRLSVDGSTFYGTTSGGGQSGNGTVYKIDVDGGAFTVLHHFSPGALNPALSRFTNSDGQQPQSKLVISSSGVAYGTTTYGGLQGNGTLFKVGTNGQNFFALRHFANGAADGSNPHGNLVITSSGFIYGTTEGGGPGGAGIVYKIDTNGNNFTIVHNFSFGQATNGGQPFAGLTPAGGSLMYGTTYSGGAFGGGTVYRLNVSDGSFSLVKSFPALVPSDFTGTNVGGALPRDQIELAGGLLFGTTTYGGTSSNGTVFAVGTNGSGFAVLHNFSPTSLTGYGGTTNSDGANSADHVVLVGNTLYGTTEYRRRRSRHDFQVTTNGNSFAVLRSIAEINGFGGVPTAGLLLVGNTFYGAMHFGGNANSGALYLLTLPQPQLTIAPAGTNVTLSWSLANSSYQLQSATGLEASATWNPVLTLPTIVNGSNSVNDRILGSPRFYRLSQ